MGLILGCSVMALQAAFSPDLPIGPSISGLLINVLVTIFVSFKTEPVPDISTKQFHDMYDFYMVDNCDNAGIETSK